MSVHYQFFHACQLPTSFPFFRGLVNHLLDVFHKGWLKTVVRYTFEFVLEVVSDFLRKLSRILLLLLDLLMSKRVVFKEVLSPSALPSLFRL